MKSLIYLSILLFILQGCSNNLSRSKAKDQIVKNLELPKVETVKLDKKYKKKHESRGFGTICLDNIKWYSEMEKILTELQSQDFITMAEEFEHRCSDLNVIVTLTEKGKNSLINEKKSLYEIKLCDIEFGEVTGISEYKEYNAADVNYTLKKTNYTELGKIIKGSHSNEAQTINRLANFSKFDDGWRMDVNKSPSLVFF